MSIKRFVCMAMAGVLSASAAFAATITVNPGLKTLTAAINAATPGDILELTNGTFEEGSMRINKQLEIRAAAGANPLVNITTANVTPGSGTLLMDFTAAGVIWDGVDINLNANDTVAPRSIRGIVLRGETSTIANPVVFQNMNITDGPDALEPGAWLFAVESSRYCILNNVNFMIDQASPSAGIFAYAAPAVIELNNCDLRIKADSIISAETADNATQPALIRLNNSTVGAGASGVAFMFQSIHGGSFELNDSTVLMTNQVLYRGVLMRLANNFGTFTANRTLFDASTATNGIYAFNGEGPNAEMDMTNCVIKYTSKNPGSSPFAMASGGTLRLKHCTIIDVDPIPYGTRSVVYSALAQPGAAGHLEVKNCLMEVAGVQPAAYIYDQADLGADNSNLTYDIGRNLISGTTANVQAPGNDGITRGTVVEANGATILVPGTFDPFPGGLAVDGAVNIGVTVDFNGFARPFGPAPDFGAVESDGSGLPTAVSHWSLY